MYAVSESFENASKEPIQRWHIRGFIGSLAFTEANILDGSFAVYNQCSESDDITLGSVYIGVLECTFIGLSDVSWAKKDISVEVGLEFGGGLVEYVPMGIYRVAEATKSTSGVTIKAYDNMRLLDRAFTVTDLGAGLPYTILEYIATRCGVALGIESLSGFTNANMPFQLMAGSDIETYRDLLYWLAQACCAFATIDRQGRLVLRRFDVDTSIDTLGAEDRFVSSQFSEYATHYTGVSVVQISDGVTKYYGASVDDGTTINLGQNPFLQNNPAMVRNILASVQNMAYTPFDISVLSGFHYDLGDVIECDEGLVDGGVTCMVMSYNYGRSNSLKGYGANPQLASAKSKSDKNISALLDRINAEEIQYIEYNNAEQITVGSTMQRVARLRYATAKETTLMFKAEIRLSAECDEVSTSSSVTVDDAVVTVRYDDNNQEVAIHPKETYLDGDHVLHLLYAIHADAGALAYFDVSMQCVGGTLTIDAGDLSAWLEGLGLVGDTEWDGNIEIEDAYSVVNIPAIDVQGYTDSMSIARQEPTRATASDTYEPMIVDAYITITGFEDAITVDFEEVY